MYTEMYHFGSQTEALLPSCTNRKITESAPKMETVDTQKQREQNGTAVRPISRLSKSDGRWAWAATETMSGAQSVRGMGVSGRE